MPSIRLFILFPLLLIVISGAAIGFATASSPARSAEFWASWEAAGRPSLAMIAELQSRKEASEWPPFSMVYELAQGQAVRVGNRQIDPRQVRRYDYVSPTQWKDTVLESAPIDTRVGTFSEVGSYQMVNGRHYTEFNAPTNSLMEETLEKGSRRVPGGIPSPFQILEFEVEGLKPTRAVTTATVCFQDECRENAEGLLYVTEDGRAYLFADDSRGIPLRIGTVFLVRELRVKDVRK